MKTRKKSVGDLIWEYFLITVSTLCVTAGVYFFKFPNNFTFGGVTGLAVAVARLVPWLSPSAFSTAANILLLLLGFAFFGKGFTLKTVYSSLLLSFGLSALEKLLPLSRPLTDEPMLELIFAVLLPAFGSAVLFHVGASSGGTDIVAMILRKYTSIDVGRALLLSDSLITLSAFFIFDVKTALFSALGLIAKSLVVDNVIESINLCKYFNIVCSDPDLICDFIVNKIHRSATVCKATGAFTGEEKYMVFTAMKRYQAMLLRDYIRRVEPDAFLLISNTSEIIGKGFHGGQP